MDRILCYILFSLFVFFVKANDDILKISNLDTLQKFIKDSNSNIYVIISIPDTCASKCTPYTEVIKRMPYNAMPGVTFIEFIGDSVPLVQNLESPGILMVMPDKQLVYQGNVNEDDLYQSIQMSKEVHPFFLDDTNFEHDTQAASGGTTGDWLVVFDSNYQANLPFYEGLALRLRTRYVNLAVLDASVSPRTAERFQILKKSPVFLIRHGGLYLSEVDAKNFDKLYHFATNWYVNFKKFPVPKPITSFDVFTDRIVSQIKHMESIYGETPVRGAGLVVCLIVLGLFFVLLRCYTSSKPDDQTADTKKNE